MIPFAKGKNLIGVAEAITCPYCKELDGKGKQILDGKHVRKHGKTLEDVRTEFPDWITMTYEQQQKRVMRGKNSAVASKIVKCFYHEDDDCPDDDLTVNGNHGKFGFCDHCKRAGKEDPDGRTHEHANVARIETLQKRYGEDVTNARGIDGVNDKILETCTIRYGGIGMAGSSGDKTRRTMLNEYDNENAMHIEKFKNKTIQCTVCDREVRVAINYENEICPDCNNMTYPNQLEVDDKRIVCQVCWKAYGRIDHKHLAKHDMTLSEYKLKYSNAPLFSKHFIEMSRIGGIIGGSLGHPIGFKFMTCRHCNVVFKSRLCADSFTRCPQCKREGVKYEGYTGSDEYRKKQSLKFLSGFATYVNSFNTTNTTKPQKALYKIIKKYYPDAELEVPFFEINRTADIVISSLNIIVESDGSRYHQDKDRDDYRDFQFNQIGWRVIRFKNMDNVSSVPIDDIVIHNIELFKSSDQNVIMIE